MKIHKKLSSFESLYLVLSNSIIILLLTLILLYLEISIKIKNSIIIISIIVLFFSICWVIIIYYYPKTNNDIDKKKYIEINYFNTLDRNFLINIYNSYKKNNMYIDEKYNIEHIYQNRLEKIIQYLKDLELHGIDEGDHLPSIAKNVGEETEIVKYHLEFLIKNNVIGNHTLNEKQYYKLMVDKPVLPAVSPEEKKILDKIQKLFPGNKGTKKEEIASKIKRENILKHIDYYLIDLIKKSYIELHENNKYYLNPELNESLKITLVFGSVDFKILKKIDNNKQISLKDISDHLSIPIDLVEQYIIKLNEAKLIDIKESDLKDTYKLTKKGRKVFKNFTNS